MMSNNNIFFEYNGLKYAYNASRLFELCVKQLTNEADDTQVTIQKSYSNEPSDCTITEIGKEVVETTSSINKDLMNIKYNFYKGLIDDFFNGGFDENGIVKEFDLADLTMCQVMAFNTLVNEGIITVLE